MQRSLRLAVFAGVTLGMVLGCDGDDGGAVAAHKPAAAAPAETVQTDAEAPEEPGEAPDADEPEGAGGGTPLPEPNTLQLDLGDGVTMDLVLIPAGEFMMGSAVSAAEVARLSGGGEAERSTSGHTIEHPEHLVRITKAFYMGVTEVTQEQYGAVKTWIWHDPSWFKGAQNPVEGVSWHDAVNSCRRLSARTGREVRLPTEAEWEYACRAGTTTPFSFGETISTDQANYDGDKTYGTGRRGVGRNGTTPVGSFTANPWGLYDMHGNVAEWCQDWQGRYPTGTADDPIGPATGTLRMLRGGSWDDYPWNCRSASRYFYMPRDFHRLIGFRVVVSPRP